MYGFIVATAGAGAGDFVASSQLFTVEPQFFFVHLILAIAPPVRNEVLPAGSIDRILNTCIFLSTYFV